MYFFVICTQWFNVKGKFDFPVFKLLYHWDWLVLSCDFSKNSFSSFFTGFPLLWKLKFLPRKKEINYCDWKSNAIHFTALQFGRQISWRSAGGAVEEPSKHRHQSGWRWWRGWGYHWQGVPRHGCEWPSAREWRDGHVTRMCLTSPHPFSHDVTFNPFTLSRITLRQAQDMVPRLGLVREPKSTETVTSHASLLWHRCPYCYSPGILWELRTLLLAGFTLHSFCRVILFDIGGDFPSPWRWAYNECVPFFGVL